MYKRVHLFRAPPREKIEAAYAQPLSMRDRLILELAYGSGLRRIELHRLNVEDIDLSERLVCVVGKGGRERVVPITNKAAEVLRGYLCTRSVQKGPLLLSYAGRRLTTAGIHMVCALRIGVRAHLLRHACATHMLQSGANIRILSELLGHRKLSTTQLYAWVGVADLEKRVNALHPRGKLYVASQIKKLT